MKYLKTDVTFEIGYETFTCSGKQIIDPGFSSVMHWRSQQNENLPMIDKEATYPVVELNSNESETTPPDYLSEADLLGLMEKYGIGTDASMAVHIASICNRNYVDVKYSSYTHTHTLSLFIFKFIIKKIINKKDFIYFFIFIFIILFYNML